MTITLKTRSAKYNFNINALHFQCGAIIFESVLHSFSSCIWISLNSIIILSHVQARNWNNSYIFSISKFYALYFTELAPSQTLLLSTAVLLALPWVSRDRCGNLLTPLPPHHAPSPTSKLPECFLNTNLREHLSPRKKNPEMTLYSQQRIKSKVLSMPSNSFKFLTVQPLPTIPFSPPFPWRM